MSLAEIQGQPIAVAVLRNLRASGRLAHAYLFHGPEGVGKFKTAAALAAAGLCPAAGPDGACGRCADCGRVVRREHPGLHVVELASDRTLIPIDDVRAALDRISLKSVDGRDRWILVRDAEWLSDEAANALLKTLEEPPPGVRWILVTARPQSLPPTILSRCHSLAFGPLPDEVVVDLLARVRSIDTLSARRAARYAGGSFGRAVRLLESDLEERRRWAVDRYLALDGGNLFAFVEEVGDFAKDAGGGEASRDRVRLVLDFIATFLRDALLLGAGAPAERLSAPEEVDDLRRLLGRMDLDEVVAALDQLQIAEGEISRNANQKLVLGNFLLADGRIPR